MNDVIDAAHYSEAKNAAKAAATVYMTGWTAAARPLNTASTT
jgi:hypothetical protein